MPKDQRGPFAVDVTMTVTMVAGRVARPDRSGPGGGIRRVSRESSDRRAPSRLCRLGRFCACAAATLSTGHGRDDDEDREKRYAELVGEKLRRMRQDRGLSLQEVCDRSGGSFVVSTLSAYERGKRSLSLERLYELAAIYGQSPMSSWTSRTIPSSSARSPATVRCASAWRASERSTPEERRPLETYLAFLRQLRNDPARDMLTIRKDDLAYLSGLYGVRPQALKDYLEKEGVLLTCCTRPAGRISASACVRSRLASARPRPPARSR